MMKHKKVLSVLIALMFVFSVVAPVGAAVPGDAVGHSAESAIGKLMSVGVIEGFPDGTVRPDGLITRAEFSKIAVVAMGLEEAAASVMGPTPFTDTVDGAWYSGYVNVAASNGLILGYPDGTFGPNRNLTNNEAITILVRLLGMGPVVEKAGTWPSNYVGRAANEGILKGVAVAGSANALRGNVFRMLNNSLTINIWGAIGFNSDGTVNYGRLVPAETLLNDRLDVVSGENRVTDFDLENGTVTLGAPISGAIAGATYDVLWDLDLYDAYLRVCDVWMNEDDEIIYLGPKSTQHIDAININAALDKVRLEGADRSIDAAGGADMLINGVLQGGLVAGDFNFAKVVLNADGEVWLIDAWNWNDWLVVEEVDGTEVLGYGESEDMEDFVITKDGKVIGLDGLEPGDILFFHAAGEFAEVYNDSVSGDITHIFTDRMRVAGKDYRYVSPNIDLAAVGVDMKYLDEDDEIDSVTAAVAEQFQDEGPVVVFRDRKGGGVFVDGDLGAPGLGDFLGYVWEDTLTYTDRGVPMRTLEVVTEEGVLWSADVKVADVPGYTGFANIGAWDAQVLVGTVLKITLDADAKIDDIDIELPQDPGGPGTAIVGPFDTSDSFVGGLRLRDNTKVFMIQDFIPAAWALGDGWDYTGGALRDEEDIEVILWGDVDFDSVDESQIVPDANNNVKFIVAWATDKAPDTTDYYALATSDSKQVQGKNIYHVSLIVDNWAEREYVIDTGAAIGAIAAGNMLQVRVEDGTSNITAVLATDAALVGAGTVVTVNLNSVDHRNRKFDAPGAGNTRTLVDDGLVVDEDFEVIGLRDLETGANVKILYLGGGTTFVKYVYQP